MGKQRTVAAGQFKTHCLALLDEVHDGGQEIVITKRGRPVARLMPLAEREERSLAGSIVCEGDLLSPIDQSWDAEG